MNVDQLRIQKSDQLEYLKLVGPPIINQGWEVTLDDCIDAFLASRRGNASKPVEISGAELGMVHDLSVKH